VKFQVKLTRRNAIPELAARFRPRAGRAVNRWARAVYEISQQLVPVDTGDLKASGEIVNYENTRGDGRQRGVAKAVSYTAEHASYVELGTANAPAQPFLLPAYEAVKASLIDELKQIASTNNGQS